MPVQRPIFVEGPDGSGKSTLVQKLVYERNTFGVHTGGPPRSEDDMIARVFNLMELCRVAPKPLVFDRCPPVCEMVYPVAFGRPMYLNQSVLLWVIEQINPVIVYCRRGTEIMKADMVKAQKGHKPYEHLQKVLDRFPALVEAYDEAFAVLDDRRVKVIEYDWGRDSFTSLAARISACVD